MKWIKTTDRLPETVNLAKNTGISRKVLVWLNSDDTFVTGSIVINHDTNENVWLSGYNGVDISKKVTYWADVEGPKND